MRLGGYQDARWQHTLIHNKIDGNSVTPTNCFNFTWLHMAWHGMKLKYIFLHFLSFHVHHQQHSVHYQLIQKHFQFTRRLNVGIFIREHTFICLQVFPRLVLIWRRERRFYYILSCCRVLPKTKGFNRSHKTSVRKWRKSQK